MTVVHCYEGALSQVNTQQLSGSCCKMTILQSVAISAPFFFPLAAAAGHLFFSVAISSSFFFPHDWKNDTVIIPRKKLKTGIEGCPRRTPAHIFPSYPLPTTYALNGLELTLRSSLLSSIPASKISSRLHSSLSRVKLHSNLYMHEGESTSIPFSKGIRRKGEDSPWHVCCVHPLAMELSPL